jgi:hypothetical protein
MIGEKLQNNLPAGTLGPLKWGIPGWHFSFKEKTI